MRRQRMTVLTGVFWAVVSSGTQQKKNNNHKKLPTRHTPTQIGILIFFYLCLSLPLPLIMFSAPPPPNKGPSLHGQSQCAFFLVSLIAPHLFCPDLLTRPSISLKRGVSLPHESWSRFFTRRTPLPPLLRSDSRILEVCASPSPLLPPPLPFTLPSTPNLTLHCRRSIDQIPSSPRLFRGRCYYPPPIIIGTPYPLLFFLHV